MLKINAHQIPIAKVVARFPRFSEMDPPIKTLFLRGRDDILFGNMLYVSVVGTRRASSYGLKVAEMFASHIAKRGHCVVSGLASGVDTIAHRAALAWGGATIGVSACGIDSIYPPSNRKLYEMMSKNGCIVSEYPGVLETQRYRFPHRNRIVAALSDLIIVVEAPKKSGALITATLGLEVGIDVCAVPGSIFSDNYIGSNALIESGATPLSSTLQLDFILDQLAERKSTEGRYKLPPKKEIKAATDDEDKKTDTKAAKKAKKQEEKMMDTVKKRLSITDDILNNMDERDNNLQKRCEDLSGASSDVLHYIRTMRQANVFKIANSVGISETDALAILEELEEEKIIEKNPDDEYSMLDTR